MRHLFGEVETPTLKPNIMKTKKNFKIAILEDSAFYNSVLTRQLRNYTDTLAIEKGYHFDIHSYTTTTDYLRNLEPDTDIAFVDYYLGQGVTAKEIMQEIKKKCDHCEVVVLSQERSVKTAHQTISDGAFEFIYKDIYALPKSCFAVENIINKIN
jgi:DNA-binding NtrC family response regulator